MILLEVKVIQRSPGPVINISSRKLSLQPGSRGNIRIVKLSKDVTRSLRPKLHKGGRNYIGKKP